MVSIISLISEEGVLLNDGKENDHSLVNFSINLEFL